MKTERTQLIENMILSEIDFFKHKDQLKTETDPKKIAILQSCIENDTIILDTWIENYDIIADDILPSRTQVLLNAKDSMKNSYQTRINFLIEEVHNLHAENTENNTERYGEIEKRLGEIKPELISLNYNEQVDLDRIDTLISQPPCWIF